MPLARDRGHRFDALVGHADGRPGRSCLLGEVHMSRSKAGLIVTLALALLAAPLAAAPQQTPKIAKIGLLVPSSPAATAHLVEAFRQGLREFGYVEGKNFVLEPRYGEAKAERLLGLA